MADQMRSCRKTACRWPAAASLSFRYGTKEVWLLDLSADADPNLYDLCPHHADVLTVPNGWTSVDQRSAQSVPVEPAAADRGTAGTSQPRPTPAGAPVSRYEALARDLPRLAAEWANGEGSWAGETPLTSAPPVRASVSSPARGGEDTGERSWEESVHVPGQLAIPVGDVEARDDAVVVSIELARRSP